MKAVKIGSDCKLSKGQEIKQVLIITPHHLHRESPYIVKALLRQRKKLKQMERYSSELSLQPQIQPKFSNLSSTLLLRTFRSHSSLPLQPAERRGYQRRCRRGWEFKDDTGLLYQDRQLRKGENVLSFIGWGLYPAAAPVN